MEVNGYAMIQKIKKMMEKEMLIMLLDLEVLFNLNHHLVQTVLVAIKENSIQKI